MAKTWIKLYTEALHDRKMRKLSRFDKSVFYDLLILAGQEDQNGFLPDIEDIALELDLKVTEASDALTRLIKAGVISRTDDGELLVTNYSKRQESNLTSYEKVKRYREKKNEVITDNPNDNQMITEYGNQEVITDNPNDNQMITDENSNDNQHISKMITAEEELRIKNKEVEEEYILNKLNITNSMDIKQHNAAKAAVREKTGRQKLTPDQKEYWIQGFGPEAERAEAFSRASGIVPISGEFGRWQKDLRAFTEAGISIDQMIRAIRKVQKDGRYPIKAPGTVLTEARNLAAAKNKPPEKRGFDAYAAELNNIPRQEWDVEL